MSGEGNQRASSSRGSGSRRQRSYQSALRDERAADTRARIVAAARELFAARGFTAATVARIAERAGVSQPTVYAVFGGKGAIMRELVNRLETEAGGADWSARINAESDPRRKLEWYAAWHRDLFSTGCDVLAATLSAGGDPAVVELRDEGDRSARAWLEPIVSALAAAGALSPGLTEQEAIDRAWILTSFEVYFRATHGRGWTDSQYQQWLTQLLHHQLLADPPTATARNGDAGESQR